MCTSDDLKSPNRCRRLAPFAASNLTHGRQPSVHARATGVCPKNTRPLPYQGIFDVGKSKHVHPRQTTAQLGGGGIHSSDRHITHQAVVVLLCQQQPRHSVPLPSICAEHLPQYGFCLQGRRKVNDLQAMAGQEDGWLCKCIHYVVTKRESRSAAWDPGACDPPDKQGKSCTTHRTAFNQLGAFGEVCVVPVPQGLYLVAGQARAIRKHAPRRMAPEQRHARDVSERWNGGIVGADET
jgi:hypothetical protein